jgi:predicted nuclease of restriction endonuclease-like RecB superfamily
LLPESLLRHSVRQGVIVPHFLGENDYPWLRGLLEDVERYVGHPQRELEGGLREPGSREGPSAKRALAVHVLRRLWGSRQQSPVPPKRARAALFGVAAASGEPREAVLSRVAEELAVSAAELETSLFGDLPGERLVVAPDARVSPGELALRVNLALAQGFLFRASAVVIEAEGNAHALVRHGKLRGLICTVNGRGDSGDAVLEISGPFALFRHTLVYGRALGELVPLLAWCRRFRLRARCQLREKSLVLELASGDPIFPSLEPRRYDSQLEERFARDFRRAARDWDLVREPEPVRAGGTLVFPDFALEHRHDPTRRWLLEIVGFWTPDYLARKLAQYRAAGLANLILCIDEARDCAGGDLPRDARVLRFRRRVDASAVLALVNAEQAVGLALT